MTLIERVNKELNKVGLRFETTKECNDKFKGNLFEGDNLVMEKYEIYKCLQYNAVSSFSKHTRDMVDMQKKLKQMGGIK